MLRDRQGNLTLDDSRDGADVDDGYYGDDDPEDAGEPRPSPEYPAEDSAARVLMRWVFGVASVVALVALFGAYTFGQMSSERPAKTIIANAIIPITEVDAVLTRTYGEELQVLASEAAASDEQVILPGLPILLAFDAQEIEGRSLPELRDLILRRSADRVYEEGLDAFRQPDPGDEAAPPREIERLSPQGAVDVTLGSLNRDAHDRMDSFINIAGIAAALALTLFLMLGRGLGRFTLLGVVVFVAALFSLIGTYALRAALETLNSAGGDPFIEGLNRAAETAVSIPVRNYTVLSAAGLAIILIGVAVSLLGRRMQFREDW